jgi:hypothetical protein
MINRQENRKAKREISSILDNAKRDMASWIISIGTEPTEKETAAWQNGYISGINRVRNELSGRE